MRHKQHRKLPTEKESAGGTCGSMSSSTVGAKRKQESLNLHFRDALAAAQHLAAGGRVGAQTRDEVCRMLNNASRTCKMPSLICAPQRSAGEKTVVSMFARESAQVFCFLSREIDGNGRLVSVTLEGNVHVDETIRCLATVFF